MTIYQLPAGTADHYSATDAYNPGGVRYDYAVPVRPLADGTLMADFFPCDADGNLHPGYNVSGEPMHLAGLTPVPEGVDLGVRVACPEDFCDVVEDLTRGPFANVQSDGKGLAMAIVGLDGLVRQLADIIRALADSLDDELGETSSPLDLAYLIGGRSNCDLTEADAQLVMRLFRSTR